MKLIAAIPLTTVLLAGTAFGQQTTRDQQRQQQQQQTQQETRQHTDQHAQARSMHVLSGEIIGKEVVDRRGESLGKIGDLVVDLRKGETPYAVLTFGGTLGFNRDHVAVPMGAFTWDEESDRYTINTTKERLESAPEFDKSDLDKIAEENWIDRTNRAFGTDRSRGEGRQQTDRQEDRRDRGADEGRQQRDQQQTGRDQDRRDRSAADEDNRFKPHAMVSDLDSMKVVTSDAEEIGSIRRLVIDRNSGRIGFVTLRTSGVMGMGSDTHVIPWEAIEQTEEKKFQVSITKQRFENAPELANNAQLHESAFIQSVYTFYQVTPRDADRSDQRRQDDRRLEERRERRQGG
ncbi:MAG: PRC-barrel domain-containing protein [Phycisphaerales bacterium]|nr:PRC-barrel domain-containing protein [Phycisphaerales bacterium]